MGASKMLSFLPLLLCTLPGFGSASLQPSDDDFAVEQIAPIPNYDRYTISMERPKDTFEDMWREHKHNLPVDMDQLRSQSGMQMTAEMRSLRPEQIKGRISQDIGKLPGGPATFEVLLQAGTGNAVGVAYKGKLVPLPNLPRFDKAMDVLRENSGFRVSGPVQLNSETADLAMRMRALSLELTPKDVKDVQLLDNERGFASRVLTVLAVFVIVTLIVVGAWQMGTGNLPLGIVLILLAIALAVDVYNLWHMPMVGALDVPYHPFGNQSPGSDMPPKDESKLQKELNAKSQQQAQHDQSTTAATTTAAAK